MNTFLFLMVGAGVLMVVGVKNNVQVNSILQKHHKSFGYLPKAVSMLVVTAQIPELVKVVEHASIVNVVTSLFLLVILVATKSGTESELH